VTIGVFGLFQPQKLTLAVRGNDALIIHAGERSIALERSANASVRLVGKQVVASAGSTNFKADRITISGRQHQPVDFELAVPGRIRRHYRGMLEFKTDGSSLTAIVTMDCETAVASIVAAESSPDTPIEALEAQAVVARSYLVAGRGRHKEFDFCDTTHCQFLREPPAADSNVAKAVEKTRGLVLTYRSQAVAAMYSRSCSGRTHTPSELGLSSPSYPYYSVKCAYCQSHPARWSSRISNQDATELRTSDESSRLRLVRRLGWGVVPSNDFIPKQESGYTLLEGVGQGHGIGLCQSGAKAMSEAGTDFRQILAHYYPNTTIAETKARTASRRIQ
jgi:stage II sporulation protein D (peptidoglycan lytic transglycosylase)